MKKEEGKERGEGVLSRRKMNNLKLKSLLEITKAINSNVGTQELFTIYEHILVNDLKIGKLALFIHASDWICVLKKGMEQVVEDDIQFDENILKFKEITEINVFGNSDSFDVVIPVFHNAKAIAYLLIGDLDEDKLEMSPTIKHLPFIQTLTNIILVAIENQKLTLENIRQEGEKKEMKMASEMQSMLFPSSLPNDDKLEIAAYYQPHQQVGGDYYDFIRLNKNEVVFCMADVSGKGVSAALLMANFQANLRALFRHNSSLPEVILELNELVFKNAMGEKFITLFVAKYNTVTKVLSYINAGHNPPLLLSKSNPMMLTTGCIGLGMLEEIPRIKEGIITVAEGSILLCYTDGLVEQNNNMDEEFGFDNMTNVLMRKSNLPMYEVNNQLINSLNKFKQNRPYIDDIALLSCRFI
ncbi:MAG: PP2C family protein-serine/threonine phosphatase [Bacteroidetes bacterium]|nr:PP2C family protein-serine/threonine phosphatase [Bacteroidota bacterium]MBK9671871.1 PP2C family protein-serine/threonine phosphatase [Bacteroidota bacterium]MBK9798556.1 PP2C family protein-serine/threonine phosphatase [Bacteroidota bacterium]MBP6413222.1 PP2C family protein-serine/threonine phosphatase [Bacteroidia bacterium]